MSLALTVLRFDTTNAHIEALLPSRTAGMDTHQCDFRKQDVRNAHWLRKREGAGFAGAPFKSADVSIGMSNF